MANKTLGTRQKLVFHLSPAQNKPRNLAALAARQSGAGSHQKSTAALRQKQKLAIKKIPVKGEPD